MHTLLILLALTTHLAHASDSYSSSTESYSYECELVELHGRSLPGVFAIKLPDTQPNYAIGVFLPDETKHIDPESLRLYRPPTPPPPRPNCCTRLCRRMHERTNECTSYDCLIYSCIACLSTAACGMCAAFTTLMIMWNIE